MRVAIASDHAGWPQKQKIAEHLRDAGHEVVDLGPATGAESVDYPDYADPVARMVAAGEADRGVLVCGTGIGMALAADKVAGVRASVITNVAFARLFREHNDGNVLCLSGRFVGLRDNLAIVDAFLATPFDSGRHAPRVAKVMREDDPAFGGVGGGA